MSSIEQYIRKNIEATRNCSIISSKGSTSELGRQSLLLRRSLESREHSYQLKDIIIPRSMEKRITKEELFSIQSNSTSTETSSPVPFSVANTSNMGNYDSDSPLEFDECMPSNSTDNAIPIRDDSKIFFPPCFRRSMSQQLPSVSHTLNENTISLFTPENLKQHNKGLERSVANNIELDSSIQYINQHPPNTTSSSTRRLSRSTSPSKLLKENREKVCTWLRTVPVEDRRVDGIFGTNNTAYTHQSFRNSNSITSKDLAKSF